MSTIEKVEGKPHTSLKNIVIVMNRRFVPKSKNGQYIYGVVQHVMYMASLFESCGIRPLFLYYGREQSRETPVVEKETLLGYESVTVRFDFGMAQQDKERAFAQGLDALNLNWDESIIYSQSIAVADFFPDYAPMVVTNHSPFVESVFQALGPEMGRRAFDWDHPKADFLLVRQGEALSALAKRPNVSFAEISHIQLRYLRGLGFDEARLIALPPGVGRRPVPNDELLPDQIKKLTKDVHGKCALFPVSRFDYFKDVDFFMDAAAIAMENGTIATTILVGSEPDDPKVAELREKLKAPHRDNLIHFPRQPHDVLTRGIFPWIAQHGVVVCSSRYDLVPYTMLEAILAGAQVLIPASDYVGAKVYVPQEWTYSRTPEKLAEIMAVRADEMTKQQICNKVEEQVSDENVIRFFLAAAQTTALTS